MRSKNGSQKGSGEVGNQVAGDTQWSPDLLKTHVYDRMLLDLILGELAPGVRLDEQDLVRRYDAGLAGVRDALGRLALEGLVIRRARSGTTVAPLDLIEARQAFEARGLIEPYCAVLAAQNAGKEDIAAMRAAFVDAESAVARRDTRALIVMDQRFHAAVARATRNATLARIVIPLQHKAARFWVFSMAGDEGAKQMVDIDQHIALIGHIERHNGEAARAAMLDLLGLPSEEVSRAVSAAPATTAATNMPH
jgi:DNA-binding GntR family transcriptional regulator